MLLTCSHGNTSEMGALQKLPRAQLRSQASRLCSHVTVCSVSPRITRAQQNLAGKKDGFQPAPARGPAAGPSGAAVAPAVGLPPPPGAPGPAPVALAPPPIPVRLAPPPATGA